MLRRPIPELTHASADRLRNSQSTPATARSPHPPAPPQRGAARPQRGVPASRPRSSVELTPADPASAWSSAASAWSCPGRSRFSVELTGSSVEFLPVNPATAWSCAAPAWSSRQQTPLQRGARRLQRGVAPSRSRFSVGLDGSSVELAPADPATAWSWAPSAWSSPRQTPLQRGADRLQRGADPSRSRFSVELTGLSVELAPADPASAWSWAPSAWSCGRQIPLQRGADRLQRGVPANRSRYSVELGGFSVELPPADPASAWGWTAPAWS